MAQCALKSPIVAILNYHHVCSMEEVEIKVESPRSEEGATTPTYTYDREHVQQDYGEEFEVVETETQRQLHAYAVAHEHEQEDERMRMARLTYQRRLAREIDGSCILKTRKGMFTLTLSAMYPDLAIPDDLVQLILDFEQNDSLKDIFKLFGHLKTATICNFYPIPWVIGCIQMLILAYLSSEVWMHVALRSEERHLFSLQILGAILTAVSLCQLYGCYMCLRLNLKPEYIQKLVNLKYVFSINHLTHYYDNLQYMKSHELDDTHSPPMHPQQPSQEELPETAATTAVTPGSNESASWLSSSWMHSKHVFAWELYVPFQKWCGALRIQNIYNVRNAQCKPHHILSFYLIKPIFCCILGIQLLTLSPHCLSLWLLFYLYFTALVSINVFNKSPIGSLIGCTILILIISVTSIPFYPNSFEHTLAISFDICVFIIFLLYLFSLYLICCSGRVSSNRASGNIIITWILLFTCYCLWVSELLYTDYAVNLVLVFSIYLLYIAFQMLLLTASDLQSVGINCYFQIKFMLVAICFGWLCDLDTLCHLCYQHKHLYINHQHDRDDDKAKTSSSELERNQV